MRAREFYTALTSKPLLNEYNRGITLKNPKTIQDIAARLISGNSSDYTIFDHWLKGDRKIHDEIKRLRTQGDARLKISTPQDLERRITQLAQYLRVSSLNQDSNNKTELVGNTVIDNNVLANSVLKEIEEYDPTSNKKYVPWMLREYLKGNIKRLEDMTAVNDLLNKFDQYKNRRGFPATAKDIMKLDSTQLRYVVRRYNPDDPTNISQDMGKYEVVYGNIEMGKDEYGVLTAVPGSDIVVITPKDETAAIYFGRVFGGLSEWCTSYVPPMTNRFESYNAKGPLYIIVPRDPEYPGEKYQLHGPTDQYMNEQDNLIDVYKLLTERFPELESVLVPMIPELDNSVVFADHDIVLAIWKTIGGIAKKLAKNEINRQRERTPYTDDESENINNMVAEVLMNQVEKISELSWQGIVNLAQEYEKEVGRQATVNTLVKMFASELQGYEAGLGIKLMGYVMISSVNSPIWTGYMKLYKKFGEWQIFIKQGLEESSKNNSHRQVVSESFPWKNKNKIYSMLIDSVGSGPFDGGCVVFARALQICYGGEIAVLEGYAQRSVVDSPSAAQHAVLQLDGKLMDADGVGSPREVVSRFERSELAHVGGKITGIRPIAENDLPDAPRNEMVSRQIAKLLQEKKLY